MILRTLVSFVAAIGLTLLALPIALWALRAADPTPIPGIRVDGDALESANPRSELAARADRLLSGRLVVDIDGRRFETDRAELGVRVDLDAMEREVRAVGHRGNPIADLRDW
jgi:hypothetical protein